jgi:hypothetical protein
VEGVLSDDGKNTCQIAENIKWKVDLLESKEPYLDPRLKAEHRWGNRSQELRMTDSAKLISTAVKDLFPDAKSFHIFNRENGVVPLIMSLSEKQVGMPVLNTRNKNQGDSWQNILPPSVEFFEKEAKNLALFNDAPVDFNLLVWTPPKNSARYLFFMLREMLLLAFHNGPPAVLVVKKRYSRDLKELVHNLSLDGQLLASGTTVYYIPPGPRGLEKEKLELEFRKFYHKLLFTGFYSILNQYKNAELKNRVQDSTDLEAKRVEEWLNSLDW